MIEHVLRASGALAPRSTTLVVGHQAEAVRAALLTHPGLTFVVQEPQLGTAHALLTTEPALRGATGTLVLLSGDVPLLSAKTLKTLVDRHESAGAAATVVTAVVERPAGLRPHRPGWPGDCSDRRGSRRQRRRSGRFAKSTPASTRSRSTGCSRRCAAIASENAQGEYYLPDIVALYRKRGLGVETLTVANADEIRGINSRVELAAVSRIVRQTKNEALMAAGVTIEDPATTYVDPDVEIGADTVIHPGVSLEGTHDDRQRLRDPQRRAHRRFAARRPRHDPQPLRHHELDHRERRGRRSVRAPAERRRRRPSARTSATSSS